MKNKINNFGSIIFSIFTKYKILIVSPCKFSLNLDNFCLLLMLQIFVFDSCDAFVFVLVCFCFSVGWFSLYELATN